MISNLYKIDAAREFADSISNFTEVNFWWSVVGTRNHQIDDSDLQTLLGITEEEVREIKRANSFMSERVNMVIPLLDMPNHHQPRFTNLSDLYHFDIVMRNGAIGIITSQPIIRNGEELAYTYNSQYLEPFQLLHNYGFTVDNNPFATMVVSTPNYVTRVFKPHESKMC